jgi:tRNA G18 (ribose-2'-O)-methylase SpoU
LIFELIRMPRLNAIQLRAAHPIQDQLREYQKSRRDLYLILDSVQDTYNVGGLFRLADAAGVKKMYLCDATECPPNTRIHKAAVGLENWVEWEYHASAAELIKQLRNQPGSHSGATTKSLSSPVAEESHRRSIIHHGPIPRSMMNHVPIKPHRGKEFHIKKHEPPRSSTVSPTFLAVEQAPGSISLDQLPQLPLPIYLTIGHETHGVSKDVLQLCDHVVELPMHGINISLNVIIAAAIVLYHPTLST